MKSLIKFSIKQDVLITTRYPGASPEEVERLVTNKIEDSLRSMENIEFIRSTSIAYQSMVYVKFEDDTDYDELYNELRFRVLGIQNQLPEVDDDLLLPQFTKVNVDEWLPVLQINLIAADPTIALSARALTLLAKDLRNRLEQLPDLKEVFVLGDVDQQFIVSVEPQKLEQHRITITEATDSIRASGDMIPAGKIDTIAGERLIRVDSRFRTRDDLLNTIIRRDGDGNMLRLRDLINEEESGIYPVDNSVISTVNGLNTVSLNVLKKTTANAIKIFKDVDAVTKQFVESRKHENLEVVYTLNSTVKIGDGIGVLSNNLMLSIVLVMLLLFLFMSHHGRKMTLVGLILAISASVIIGIAEAYFVKWISISIITLFVFITCRAAVLTVSGIVFSFLGSLTIFYFMGQSINGLSLLGFVLVCGIVVDDAIVT